MEMGAVSVLSVCVETPRAVFGVPLISLRKSGQMRQGLPLVLTHIVEFVEKHGLSKSGLFRASGSVKRCRELRISFDQGGFPEFDSGDILTPASLLKVFLRELPGALIPESHRTQLLNVFKDSKERELNQAVRTILNSLPEEHFNVLCYLMFFLSRAAAESHLNLMTSGNLSIVFGPSIFHVPLSPTMVEEQGQCNALTEHLLDNLIHLLPNMYPHAPTSITAEERDWANEECVQQLPLTKIRSKLPKIGRLGRLRKRLRGFWRKLCSCTCSNDTESGEASARVETQT
ncbi:protein FAM13A-like [Sinocyclocheilus rhinocerous]|uniref:protein FAM13A-like n=1 Tax=Sinocyclocheilus rhinocerous TaxID=307959 RepID=UPI0007B94608|nr:PREDICTED: protein FAM13A-like [Sinocyclocheilus rhinocerous]